MPIDLIRTLYRFNAWANTRILDTSEKLSPEQMLAEANPSFGSVHNTLVHIMSAQWVLNRWRGASLSGFFDPQSFPDLVSIRTRWDMIESETQAFCQDLTEESLLKKITYINFRGHEWSRPLWQMMVHQVNHATQHRSEIAVSLTNWKCSPGGMDFLVFIDQDAAHHKS
jgi:uncharacterized damage-inducible protein DinB